MSDIGKDYIVEYINFKVSPYGNDSNKYFN